MIKRQNKNYMKICINYASIYLCLRTQVLLEMLRWLAAADLAMADGRLLQMQLGFCVSAFVMFSVCLKLLVRGLNIVAVVAFEYIFRISSERMDS